MVIYVKISFISIFSPFFWFYNMILSDYQMRWFYQYRSFKQSRWLRHNLGHT